MSTETTTPPAAPAPAAAAAATAAPANAGGSAPFAPQPAASLYVGELDPSVTEAFLFEMFNVIGPVASVRVCRDAVTRRSLGYAYVNFHHQADGERALEQLNYTAIKGRPCRIMWSQRDPSMRRSGAGNVFIKNLDATIDNKALHDTFSAFGKILSCKVAFGKDGQSLGYGFVHYETREAAQAAIDAVNGMLLNDKEVFVGFHVSRREREAEMVAKRAQFTNLYVKNLPEDVTDDEFHAMFAEFGSVLSAVVQRDEEGNSKGFGFVNYAKHEEAHAAVAALNGKELRDKELYVARAQKKGEREEELRRQYEAARQERMQKYQGNNVYIKNLDDETDDDQLRNEFAQFGTITSCKVMRDEKGMSRGFGFVCFSTPDEATAAVTEMNGKILGTKPLYVALAQRKEQRRQQLEAQYAQRMTMGMPFRMGPGAPMLPPGMAPYPGMPPMYYPAPPGARPFYGQPPMGPPGPQGVPRSRWPAPMPGAPGMPGGPMPYPMQYAPMPGAPGMPSAPMPPMGMPGQGMRGGRGGRGGMMRGGAQGRMQRPPMQQQQQPQQAAPAPAQAPLNPNEAPARPSLATLVQAASSVDEKKQLLGEALYPLIAEQEPEHAPKITGMLLEMEPAEVLALFESRDELRAKVQEAGDLVREHMASA